MDYAPFLVTAKLAVLTTIILLVIAIPISHFLAFSKWKGKIILESILMLPIILPPTVLGFYYLSFLGPESGIGAFFEEHFDVSFAFSFEGILIGSVIYCLPFMVSPITSGLRDIPRNMKESVQLLGKRKFNALWKVYLPTIKTSLWSGVVLTFAHTIGEFGLVLMIGGKMEETNVASVAIYDEMNSLNYDTANHFAIILLVVSFILIVVLNLIMRKKTTLIA
ncbi:MAG: molybdate transport system permease protein [Crocinitomicaceae bacterium]|jgi:molybdate transport system permease protein